MKKMIILALCLLLCVTLAISVCAAEVTATLTPSKTTVNGGDTVTVVVSVEEFADCRSGSVRISYDTAVFERGSSSWLLTDMFMNEPNGDAVFAFSSGKTVSGEIYQFELKVKDGVTVSASDITVTLTLKNTSGESGTVTAKATFSVACTHAYDNACDTSCNLCGATRKAKHTYDDGKVTKEPTCAAEGVKTFACTACGETKTESIEKTEHTFDDGKVTTEATCTAEGVKTFTCIGCGESKTETIAKKKHAYDEGKVTKEPTCTAEGVKTFTCTGCEKTKTEAIESTGHSFDQGKVTTEATCTGEGVKTYTCSACGETKTESIESKGHTYDDGQVTVETTCTTDGEITITCTVCGKVKTEAVTAPGHQYDHDCDTDCNVCGQTQETEHNYSERWSADETGHYHACIACGEVLELVPHTPGPDPTEDEDQICLDCGFVLQPAGTHIHAGVGDWLSDGENHWHVCDCGEILDPQPHTWDEGTADDAAAQITYSCTVCGVTRTEEVQQPTETVPATQPSQEPTTQTEPTQPTQAPSEEPEEPFPWWILLLIVAILLVAAVVFVVIGVIKSKKKPGKYISD